MSGMKLRRSLSGDRRIPHLRAQTVNGQALTFHTVAVGAGWLAWDNALKDVPDDPHCKPEHL